MALWYAVMQDAEDNDWGYGSENLIAAKAKAQNCGDEAYIVVIENGKDPVAVDEIHDLEITDEEIREVAEKLATGDWNSSDFHFSVGDIDRILAVMAEIS